MKKKKTLLSRHNSYIFSPAKPPGAACATDVSADAEIPTGTVPVPYHTIAVEVAQQD
jgi:hypothetical protein